MCASRLLSLPLRSLGNGGSEAKSTHHQLFAACHSIPPTSQSLIPCTLENNGAHSPSRPHHEKADRNGAEHPKSSDQKVSAGPPVTAPQKAQGQGEEGLGVPMEPCPQAAPRRCSRHLAADITKQVSQWLDGTQTERPSCLSHQGSSSPPGSARSSRACGSGSEGQKGTHQGKGSGCRESEGVTGDGRRDASLLLSCLAKLGWCAVLSDLTHIQTLIPTIH